MGSPREPVDDEAPTSSLRPSDREFPADDRVYLIRRSPQRWSEPAIAAVFSMALDARTGVDEWEALLDELDAAMAPVIARKQSH